MTREGRECSVVGCLGVTREGKPCCPDHVHLNPHASTVVAKLEQMESERGPKVKSRRMLERELVNRLTDHGGCASLDRLVVVMASKPEVVTEILKALERRGRVRLGVTSRRKKLIASLIVKGE